MRILLVSNLYPPYWIGGYELLAAWTAEGLRQRGHLVGVLTGYGPALASRDGVRPDLDLDAAALCEAHFGMGIALGDGLVAGLGRHVFSPHNDRACRRAIDAFRPDLVSFWNSAFITLSPLLAARRKGVPSVAHLSDTAANPFRNPHGPAFPLRLRGAARLLVDALWHLCRPRRLVVPSDFLREKLVRQEHLPADRMEVLHWPVPPDVRDAGAAEPRPARGATRLLFVGSLAPEKGAQVLVEGFRRAYRVRTDLVLTIVGEAGRQDGKRLRAAAADLPVRFVGRLERADVISMYASHDVLVFPSVWDEPFSLVPLEAMAMGLAVVATTAGGTPEVVSDRQTGRLVPSGDADRLSEAILELAGDSDLVQGLAAAGQAHVREKHSFAGFLDRLADVYEGAVAGHGHERRPDA